MDLQGKRLADNDRYAFLLGSALRNNDLEQFFSIYDSIIPKDLPDVQVDSIKEQARFIADFPEDEFNELVLNARDFSLARGRPPPSPLLAMSTNGQAIFSDHSDEDESQVLGCSQVTKLDFSASSPSHRFFASGVKDDDSGLPSSTKTGRPISVSSDDTMETEEKDQCGSLRPCPDEQKKSGVQEKMEERADVTKLRELVVVSRSYKPDYDEEVPLEQDNESIESPRSDTSSTREYDVTQLDGEDGVEMTTFSSEQHGYYDEDDSDDIHASPYMAGDSWRPLECSRDPATSSINFSRSSRFLEEGRTISSLRNTVTSTSAKLCSVDESVNFSLGDYSTQSEYSPECASATSGLLRSPPFGTEKDLLNKVGESISSLLKVSSHDLSQTQAARDEETRDSKKKQKHRKTNKDDGTREGGNSGKILTKDINGNPAETEDSQQMREAHQLDDKSSVVSVSGKPGSSGVQNHEMGHTQGEDLAGSQSASRKARRNKRNARQQGIEVHPDQDESYVGNVSNIDDLVKYINNDISAENLKGNVGGLKISTGNGLPNVPAPAVPLKGSKRKDRNKVKTFETAGTGVVADASDTQWTSSLSEQSTAKQADSEEPVSTLEETQEMGNLSSTETKEDGAWSSSSMVIEAEPEVNKRKMRKNDMVKRDSGKTQKNDLVSKSKTPSNPKASTCINNDKTRTKVEDNGKDTDMENMKAKNSKRGKSKSTKKDPHEFTKQVTSPPPSSISEIPLDVPGNIQEQWCTVVSKPQKKKRSQAQASAMMQTFSPPLVAHQTRAKDFQVLPTSCPFDPHRRNQQYSAVQTPSIKPLSYPLPYLKTSESENREKDLSPSDFPVLNSSPREYRRSLENVFDTGTLISDKDSDKESSKSFPADIGLVDRCRARYRISYATMASGNIALESGDSFKAESVNSSVEDSSVEFSANSSSLKWKGSPQERRHSIGSAPKELSKNILQRTGSQEMLHCDKDLRIPAVTIPKSNPNCKDLVSSDSTGSFTSSDADSARGSEVGSEGIGDEFITSTSIDSASHSNIFTETKETTVSAGEMDRNVKTDNEKSTAAKSIPAESVHRSQSVRAETRMSSSGAKHVNNGRKKGVVFFCNKSEKFTPISGLHFGFFPEEEYASLVTNSTLNKPPVPINTEEVSQSVPEDNTCSSSLSSSTRQPTAAAASSSSISSDSKPSKGPHIAGLNGLVSPQTPAMVLHTPDNPSIAVEQTQTQPESIDSAPVPGSDCAADISLEVSEVSLEPAEKLQNKIKFTYGAQQKNKPLKYAVYLRPPEEIISREPSQDFIMSKNYLSTAWKWNNNHWVLNDA